MIMRSGFFTAFRIWIVEYYVYFHQGFSAVMLLSCGEAFGKDGQRLYEDIARKQAWLSHEALAHGKLG